MRAGGSGCPRLSTNSSCEGHDLAACRADLVNCEPKVRCGGAAAVCADPRVCSPFNCQPSQGVCLINGSRCQPGRIDAGFDCVRVERGGGFDCEQVPNVCAGCSVQLIRCAGRPTALFGR